MNGVRQVVLGVLAAMLSLSLVLGSFALALTEGVPVAIAPDTSTSTVVFLPPDTPTPPGTDIPTPTVPTPIPGEPTFTPSLTFTPSPTFTSTPPNTTCPPPAGWSAIVVQPGDTLESLAVAYLTTPSILLQANCLISHSLFPDAILYVPGIPATPTRTKVPCGPPKTWVTYTVRPGDTLYSLGQAFGVPVSHLQYANCLGSSTNIRAGQSLFVPNVPTRTPPPTHTHTPTLTPIPSLTSTPSQTPVPTFTSPPPTGTFTPTSTSTDTMTPTFTATQTATETATPTDTATATPTETNTPSGEGGDADRR
jgi:LysM repeat protein